MKTKIVAPKVVAPVKHETISFAEVVKRFKTQVLLNPSAGQRNHLAQNARGRAHIEMDLPPTTQCILHAAEYVGKIKLDDALVDAYHRIAHWLTHGCPFSGLVLITHPIKADTQEQVVEMTDALARTIDGRKAVKTNAERWCAAARDAGVVAGSEAYTFGTRANTFFKRTLRNPQDSMLALTTRVQKHLYAHQAMDRLFAVAEKSLSPDMITRYFHPGVTIAIFNRLAKLDSIIQLNEAVLDVDWVLQKLAVGKRSEALGVSRSRGADLFYSKLIELGNEPKNAELRAIGCRDQFYDAVTVELNPAMTAVGAIKAARAKRA